MILYPLIFKINKQSLSGKDEPDGGAATDKIKFIIHKRRPEMDVNGKQRKDFLFKLAK